MASRGRSSAAWRLRRASPVGGHKARSWCSLVCVLDDAGAFSSARHSHGGGHSIAKEHHPRTLFRRRLDASMFHLRGCAPSYVLKAAATPIPFPTKARSASCRRCRKLTPNGAPGAISDPTLSIRAATSWLARPISPRCSPATARQVFSPPLTPDLGAMKSIYFVAARCKRRPRIMSCASLLDSV